MIRLVTQFDDAETRAAVATPTCGGCCCCCCCVATIVTLGTVVVGSVLFGIELFVAVALLENLGAYLFLAVVAAIVAILVEYQLLLARR